MSSMHFKETAPDDWDGPVVELWDESEFVGHVFFDDVDVMVRIYPSDDREPRLLEAAELIRVLELAAKVVDPDGDESFGELRTALGVDTDRERVEAAGPIHRLSLAFDDKAIHRGEEDEGFYPRAAALAMTRRCNDIDLAVVMVEGFDLRDGELQPAKGYAVDIGKAHRGEPWATFRAGCNIQAEAVLEGWPVRDAFVVAVEVEDRNGDVYVM